VTAAVTEAVTEARVDGGVVVRVRRDERDAAARAAFFRLATGDTAAARFRAVFFAAFGPFARFDAGFSFCVAARLVADRFVPAARFPAAGLFDCRCGT
jgi:hypothetical protein